MDDSPKPKAKLHIQLPVNSQVTVQSDQEQSLEHMIENLVQPRGSLESEFDPGMKRRSSEVANTSLDIPLQDGFEVQAQESEGQENGLEQLKEDEEVYGGKREFSLDYHPKEDFFNATENEEEKVLGDIEGMLEVADEEDTAEMFQAAETLSSHAQTMSVDQFAAERSKSTMGSRGVLPIQPKEEEGQQQEEKEHEQKEEQEEEQEGEQEEEQGEDNYDKEKHARISKNFPTYRKSSITTDLHGMPLGRQIDLSMMNTMNARASTVSGYSMAPSNSPSLPTTARLRDNLSDADIMGFLDLGQQDTFVLPDYFDQEAEEEETASSVEEEKKALDRGPYYQKYYEIVDKLTENKMKNHVLQKKVTMYLKRRKVENFLKEGEHRLDQLIKYNLKLDAYQEVLERCNLKRAFVMEELNGLKEKTAQQSARLERIFKAMQTREGNVGYGLIFTKTANIIPDKMVERLIKRQHTQMEQVASMRLKYIKLKGMVQEKLNGIENIDRLENDLRLADYEQLKVENRNYADKIEERDEELTRLRSKCQNTIQVLAHMREKSSALDQDVVDFQDEVEFATSGAIACRASLAELKHARDKFRTQIEKLKMESGLLTQPDLLRDMAASQIEILKVQEDLEACQEEVNFKTTQVRNLRKNIERRTEAYNKRRLGRLKGSRMLPSVSSCSPSSTRTSRETKGGEKYCLGTIYPRRATLPMPIIKKDAFIDLVKIQPNPKTITRRRR